MGHVLGGQRLLVLRRFGLGGGAGRRGRRGLPPPRALAAQRRAGRRRYDGWLRLGLRLRRGMRPSKAPSPCACAASTSATASSSFWYWDSISASASGGSTAVSWRAPGGARGLVDGLALLRRIRLARGDGAIQDRHVIRHDIPGMRSRSPSRPTGGASPSAVAPTLILERVADKDRVVALGVGGEQRHRRADHPRHNARI